MVAELPYCGAPPDPASLLHRFNWDPRLIAALLGLAALQWLALHRRRDQQAGFIGWGVAGCALLSPLCALSVALFSARIAQHMLLILGAAPLIALATPPDPRGAARLRLWAACLAFFVALWFWHMPRPYDATFTSAVLYWLMHLTLSGSAIWLWYELLHPARDTSVERVLVGALTSMHMGLLGAVLTSASRPLYFFHLTTTQVWGLTALEDQQLGGVFMWVPGIILFLWAAMRTLGRLWGVADATRPV